MLEEAIVKPWIEVMVSNVFLERERFFFFREKISLPLKRLYFYKKDEGILLKKYMNCISKCYFSSVHCEKCCWKSTDSPSHPLVFRQSVKNICLSLTCCLHLSFHFLITDLLLSGILCRGRIRINLNLIR